MPAPIPLWWDVVANESTLSWNAGTVDADSYSDEKAFRVWNNKGGQSLVSDMTNVFITTKDSSGNDTGPVAGPPGSAYIDVEVAMYEYDADLQIGDYRAWKVIRGSNPLYHEDVLNRAGVQEEEDDIPNRIYGAINDGVYSTAASKKNYSELKLRLRVYSNATAGPVAWKTRVSYQYV